MTSPQPPLQDPSRPAWRTICLPHGVLECPVFLPDGTQGVVRALDCRDLEECHVQGIQTNVFYLMQQPGSTTIAAFGGLHRMIGWPHPLTTDSGGFQIYSLIRQNPKLGSIVEGGATFHPPNLSRKIKLTPEKSIRLQFAYGSDVLFCLDDCTHVDDPEEVQQASVDRTIKWARRCKEEFTRLVDEKARPSPERPLLFAVIQGGGSQGLRKQCADELLEIGFDGFGYGGWPLDSQGNLLSDIIAYTRELVPSEFPMHALGIGHPASIIECTRMGYSLFDSTMPTRDARHARLYAFQQDLASSKLGDDWFSFVHIDDQRYIKDPDPISPYCDCLCCTRYSRGYLHHLSRTDRSLYERLATIHNLRFMTQLMAHLRAWE